MSEWWRGAVIYQVYPRSFCDSSGDGIGDLAGITSRLDYVADLGVDAIWISPFFKSPMKDFGYDVEDFRQVDPVFGDLDDLDALVNGAHSLGLKVIIDQVYSHTSDRCSWFEESRESRCNEKADWYVWADGSDDGSPPNNWQSQFGGLAWTWDANRKQYFLHNFLPEQPDLNLHNPAVRAELLGVARFWLDRGVDGFRLDASNHFMHDPALPDNPVGDEASSVRHNASHPDTVGFLREIRAVLDQYPDRFAVAEVGGPNTLRDIQAFTSGADRLHTGYGFTFLDLQALSAEKIGAAVCYWNDIETVWPSWAFSNHDGPRVVTRWGEGFDGNQLAKTLHCLLFTLRGTVFLYQGEELGLPQAEIPFEKLRDPEAIANWPNTMGRDGTRTPMPWSGRDSNGGWAENVWMPIDERHFDICVDKQREDTESTLAHCRKLLRLRKEHRALLNGLIRVIQSPPGILAFVRAGGDESVLCVFNLTKTQQQWLPEFDPAIISNGCIFDFGGVDRSNPALLPPLSGYIAKI